MQTKTKKTGNLVILAGETSHLEIGNSVHVLGEKGLVIQWSGLGDESGAEEQTVANIFDADSNRRWPDTDLK